MATLIPITQAWGGTAASVLNADARIYNTQLRTLVAGHAAAGKNVTLVDMSALIVLNDPDVEEVFIPIPLDEGATRKFARLRVEKIPQSNAGNP